MTLSGTGKPAELFYDDLAPGEVFDLGVSLVDKAEMLGFARRFDPQWYHVDEALAAESAYGAPIASGFFTVSLFMRAYVDHVLARAAAAASPGLEELRWTAPVYAGDRLASRLAVVDRAPSRAQPGTLPVPPGPEPVADEGAAGGDDGRGHLPPDRAERVQEQVVEPEVDEVREEPDHAELAQLANQVPEPLPECVHRGSVPSASSWW